MHRQTLNQRIGLTLSALSLTLLAACGGGGEQALSGGADPVVAQPASVTTVCGVEASATTEAQAPLNQDRWIVDPLTNETTHLVNGDGALMYRLRSGLGYSIPDGAPVPMTIAMEDFRLGVETSTDIDTTVNRMGVMVSGTLAPGSVACVMGASRIGVTYEPNKAEKPSLSYDSENFGPVMIGDTRPLNGFELVHNWESATLATVVFFVDQRDVSATNIEKAEICYSTTYENQVCQNPDSRNPGTENGQPVWILGLSSPAAGVYMLRLPPETVSTE